MDLNNLPSNNKTTPNRKPNDDVVRGRVVRRKPNTAGRLVSISDNLLADFIGPTVRTLMFDVLIRAIEMIMFGESSGGRGSISYAQRAERVDYSSASGRPKVHRVNSSATRRPRRDQKEKLSFVVFSHRYEAEKVLAYMLEQADKYEVATVGDFYSKSGMTTSSMDEAWGWDSEMLRHTTVLNHGRDYFIDFPAPDYLG